MSVKFLLPGTATMPSPRDNVPDATKLSLVEESPLGCRFVATEELTPTTPAATTANSQSFLKSPSPLHRESSTHTPKLSFSSSHRVLFRELLSSQLDIEDVPDDGFFLVAPKDVFSKPTLDSPTFSPAVVRPRAHRISELQNEESLSLAGLLPSPTFRTIDENNGRIPNQDSLAPQVRLKPRPASLQDGQRAWESMSIFSCDVGAELFE